MVKKKSKERRKCRVNSHGVPAMMSITLKQEIYLPWWTFCMICMLYMFSCILRSDNLWESYNSKKLSICPKVFGTFNIVFYKKWKKLNDPLQVITKKSYASERKFCLLFLSLECLYSNKKVEIGRASLKDIFSSVH